MLHLILKCKSLHFLGVPHGETISLYLLNLDGRKSYSCALYETVYSLICYDPTDTHVSAIDSLIKVYVFKVMIYMMISTHDYNGTEPQQQKMLYNQLTTSCMGNFILEAINTSDVEF